MSLATTNVVHTLHSYDKAIDHLFFSDNMSQFCFCPFHCRNRVLVNVVLFTVVSVKRGFIF
jgi:hypothetical protein